MLGQSFPPKKQDSETSPFRLFHSPAFAPPAELKQASNMLGWEIPPLWRKIPRTPMTKSRNILRLHLFDSKEQPYLVCFGRTYQLNFLINFLSIEH